MAYNNAQFLVCMYGTTLKKLIHKVLIIKEINNYKNGILMHMYTVVMVIYTESGGVKIEYMGKMFTYKR